MMRDNESLFFPYTSFVSFFLLRNLGRNFVEDFEFPGREIYGRATMAPVYIRYIRRHAGGYTAGLGKVCGKSSERRWEIQ